MLNSPKLYYRPCLVGIKVLVLSDSTMRAFNRKRKTIPGYCVAAYGGAEILELCMVMRSGGLVKDIDLNEHRVRERILNRRDDMPIARWCKQCRDECFEKFDGKILINIGLNNAIHAADWPFVQLNEHGFMANAQVISIFIKSKTYRRDFT